MLNQIGAGSAAAVPSGGQQTNSQSAQATEYLRIIHDHLEKGEQLPADLAAPNDKKFMDALIAAANDKKTGLNAKFCYQPVEMAQAIKKMIVNGESSARFVVNMGGGTHFSAFDFALIDGRPSLIGIEPATLNAMGPRMLVFNTQSALMTHCPDVECVIIGSDLQRSNGDCGIFSLSIAKKMLKEADFLHRLHERNLADTLPVNNRGYIPAEDADQLLPPLLMKHAHSASRLDRYLAANPEAGELKVNKKGETLKEHQARYMVDISIGAKTIHYSNSIEHKREAEIRALFDQK